MSISTIVDTLQQQLELYKRILEMENSKKPLILQNDVVHLNVITQKEKLLTVKAEELEYNRNLITARYFKDGGFRYRSGLLSALIQAVSNPEEKQQLTKLHGELTFVLQELKQVNGLNQQLIEQSLAFINFSIDLMTDDPNEDVVYRHPMNNTSNNKRFRMFDNRV